jgi:pimeloyl-ACP methyl ester carboxylesterase
VATFVLVHGAFRGGWAWDRVAPLLRARGHDVWAPSLTGMGDRTHLRPAGDEVVHLTTWVDDLVSLCESHDLRDVVLVGHSQGGMVTTAAAAALADRLAELVYLDAPVPEDGECGIDLNPPGVPRPRAEDIDLSAMLPPRPVAPEDGYGEELAAWVNARLCPTPIAPSFEPVTVAAGAAEVRRRYVFFNRTPATYPCWSTRLRLDERGEQYDTIDVDHDAPLTAPDAVAAALLGD